MAKSDNIFNDAKFISMVDDLCKSESKEDVNLTSRLQRVFNEYHQRIQGYQYSYKKSIFSFPLSINEDVEKIILTATKQNESGQVSKSYNTLNKLWLIPELLPAFTEFSPRKNVPLYRARISEMAITECKELFHVPFEKRAFAATARYSIPGYPCLYLSKHVYTVWEELDRPPIEYLTFARFRATSSLRLLDLRLRRDFGEDPKNKEQKIEAYLAIMPLIIACSLQKKESRSKYQYEYIIPQILLHVFIEHMRTPDIPSKIIENGVVKYKNVSAACDDQLKLLFQEYSTIDRIEQACGQLQIQTQNRSIIEQVAAKILTIFVQSRDMRIYNEERTLERAHTAILKTFKNGFDGIIYSSTKTDSNFWKGTCNTDCLVLPSQGINNVGYCEQLQKVFKITKPLSFQVDWLKNMNVQKTKGQAYAQSYFAFIEKKLLMMKPQFLLT